MDSDQPKLSRSASTKAVLPIVGMMGGLLLGATWASLLRADELTSLVLVIRWGITGFFSGLALVLAASIPGRMGIDSVRGLMLLVLSVALLCWYVVRILFQVIGYGGP